MTRDQEIAWAAGLFEGEGCLTMATEAAGKRSGGKRHVQARLGSTDLDVVERFAAIVGFGRVYNNRRPNSPAHWKTMHEWATAEATRVRELIDLFRPYLGERRLAKAEEIYAFAALIKPYGDAVTHCPSGHEYTEENTIAEEYKRDGSLRSARRCRTCHAQRQRDARRRSDAVTAR